MRWIKVHNIARSAQKGFALPTVIIMIVVVSSVAYAALLQANNNLSLTYKQTYGSMARVAAKSAIDYAQEEFNNDRSYSGTTLKGVSSTNSYSIDETAVVLSTSADGNSKTVKGTGTIYSPKNSTNIVASDTLVRTIITTKPGGGPPPPAPGPSPPPMSYLPQSGSLYVWYRLNNDGVEAVTNDPKYEITPSNQGNHIFSTTILPFTSNGNTHALGSTSPSNKVWMSNWAPDPSDMFGGSGTACMWFKSADGVTSLNDSGKPPASTGERFLRIQSDDQASPTRSYVDLDFFTSAVGSMWSYGLKYDTGAINVTSATSTIDQKWHLFCFVGVATSPTESDNSWYVDGVKSSTINQSNPSSPFQNGWYIGTVLGGNGGAGAKYYGADGWEDEIMIWKVALTDAEIAGLAALTVP